MSHNVVWCNEGHSSLTCECPASFVLDVSKLPEILPGCLQWVGGVGAVDGLVGQVEKQWLVGKQTYAVQSLQLNMHICLKTTIV